MNAVEPARVDELPAAVVDDQVMRLIRMSLDAPSASVRDSDRLDDLGLDSLRRLVVVSLLEEQLGVSISDEAVTPETTVGELRALASVGAMGEAPLRAPNWPYWRPVRVIGNALREGLVDPVVRVVGAH